MLFWSRLLKHVSDIEIQMQNSNKNNIEQILLNIKKDTIYEILSFYVEINSRNNIPLEERKNFIEFTISPNYTNNNILLLTRFFKELKLYKLPINWVFIKYKYHDTICVSDIDSDTINLYNRLSYSTNIEYTEKSKFPLLNITIIIKNDVNKYDNLITMDDKKANKIVRHLCGEYNLLNWVNVISFIDTNMDDTLVYEDNSIYNLLLEFKKIQKRRLHHCMRCGYNGDQTKLLRCGSCHKIYYCDKICQRADRVFHKTVCN